MSLRVKRPSTRLHNNGDMHCDMAVMQFIFSNPLRFHSYLVEEERTRSLWNLAWGIRLPSPPHKTKRINSFLMLADLGLVLVKISFGGNSLEEFQETTVLVPHNTSTLVYKVPSKLSLAFGPDIWVYLYKANTALNVHVKTNEPSKPNRTAVRNDILSSVTQPTQPIEKAKKRKWAIENWITVGPNTFLGVFIFDEMKLMHISSLQLFIKNQECMFF